MTTFTKGQWPDNVCSGEIRYAKADNYDGFYLADASHGIPTFGSVAETDPVTIRGQHVKIFNYPGQTEAIAAQLVHRWNTHPKLVKALEKISERIGCTCVTGQDLEMTRQRVRFLEQDIRDIITNALSGAEETTNDN